MDGATRISPQGRGTLAAVLAGLLLSCTGKLEEPTGVPPASSASGQQSCIPGPTPLRRLSHVEYRHTLEDLFPAVTLPALALPADPRPHEFDNDAKALGPSALLLEQYASVARQVAAVVLQAPQAVLPCQPSGPQEYASCGRQFVAAHGRRLFRRPLTEAQVDAYASLFTNAPAEATFVQRAQLALQALLSAPEFLYRLEAPAEDVQPGEAARLDPYALATRLSYFLWASAPDEELLQAAGDGRLSTAEGVRAQAERLLADTRARRTFMHFHRQWLDFERLTRVTKRTEDNLTPELRASMLEESQRFVEHILYEGDGTLTDLLTSPRTYVNAPLAQLYGVTAPASGWAEVSMDPAQRSGYLTQATFLAGRGHPDKPSPVLRGVFVLERLLCAEMGAPPPGAEAMGAAIADTVTGPLTNRELYSLMTAAPACATCHTRINPAGFAFENFDTMGRFRTQEPNGLSIDASGTLDGLSFSGGASLGAALAASPQVEACVVRKWVRFAFGGGPMERAECLVQDVQQRLRASGGKLRELPLAIVTHPEFSRLRLPTPQQ